MLQTPLATQEPTSAMPTNSGITELLDKLREQRTKALAVLDSLLDAREACVTHGFVYERTDAVREVTGVSSIEASCRISVSTASATACCASSSSGASSSAI